MATMVKTSKAVVVGGQSQLADGKKRRVANRELKRGGVVAKLLTSNTPARRTVMMEATMQEANRVLLNQPAEVRTFGLWLVAHLLSRVAKWASGDDGIPPVLNARDYNKKARDLGLSTWNKETPGESDTEALIVILSDLKLVALQRPGQAYNVYLGGWFDGDAARTASTRASLVDPEADGLVASFLKAKSKRG